MKKNVIFIVAALLTAVSCKLDYFPNDAVSSSSMASPENAALATIGNYSLFKSWIDFSGFNTVGNTYIRHYQQLAELKGDNVLMSGKTTDPLFNDATMVDVSSDTNIDYFWFISYKINFATSVVINSIPEDTQDPKLLHLKGENLFMRALSHMNLIQIFATPYSWDPNAIGVVIRTSSEDPVVRATVGEVYNQVEKDLKDAISCMDVVDVTGKEPLLGKDNGYIRKAAAEGLLARLYLYEERWQDCINVIDGMLAGASPETVLDPDYSHLFQFSRESSEVLWCVAVEDAPSDYPGAQGMTGSMWYSSGDPGDGTGWAELYWSQPLMDLFNRYPEDQRYKTQHVARHASTTGKKMVYWPVLHEDGYAENYIDRVPTYDSVSGKYTCKDAEGVSHTVETETVNTYPRTYIMLNGEKQYVSVCDSMGCRTGTGGDMYPLNYMKKYSCQGGVENNMGSPAYVRWGELILDRAEAYAHLGNTEKALADVNVIRARAGLPSSAMFTSGNMAERGYSDVLDVVLDERRMELCFEGFRPYDLRRNKKDVDRRYAGRQPYKVYRYNDTRFVYYLPDSEVTASGLPQNTRTDFD